MSYLNKYIKYKHKYIQLKAQLGGSFGSIPSTNESHDFTPKDLACIGEECVICKLGILSTEEQLLKLACGHIFHEECILEWVNTHQTCAVCRREVNDYYTNQNTTRWTRNLITPDIADPLLPAQSNVDASGVWLSDDPQPHDDQSEIEQIQSDYEWRTSSPLECRTRMREVLMRQEGHVWPPPDYTDEAMNQMFPDFESEPISVSHSSIRRVRYPSVSTISSISLYSDHDDFMEEHDTITSAYDDRTLSPEECRTRMRELIELNPERTWYDPRYYESGDTEEILTLMFPDIIADSEDEEYIDEFNTYGDFNLR